MQLLELDLQFFAGEKTEKATPKKRQDARKKGQVLKSQDVTSALVLLSVFLFLMIAGTSMRDGIMSFFNETFSKYMLIDTLSIKLVVKIYKDVLSEMSVIILPIMAIAMIAGIAGNFLQFGFLFSTEPLKFDLTKLDPIKGIKRMFSVKSLIELLKCILKITLIGSVTTAILWKNIDDVLSLSFKTPGATLITVSKLTVFMGIAASVVLLIIAVLDYFYQKFEYEKNLKMSKQDIKDEYKNSEGDPLIKSKIKQRQREMAMRRMMQEVPQADVVITNPTHYAVALKYDETKRDAPYVVAKGVDHLAQKIKYIAKQNDVMTVEDRPLARALYSQTEIGDTIPEEFFKAVAEILAYVYKTKKVI